jgi:hypothetical protein
MVFVEWCIISTFCATRLVEPKMASEEQILSLSIYPKVITWSSAAYYRFVEDNQGEDGGGGLFSKLKMF